MIEIGLTFASLDTWVWLFYISGAIVVVASRFNKFNPAWGFMLLTSVGVFWGGIYIFGYLFLDGPSRNVSTGVLWLLLSWLWLAISGLIDPRLVKKKEGTDGLG